MRPRIQSYTGLQLLNSSHKGNWTYNRSVSVWTSRNGGLRRRPTPSFPPSHSNYDGSDTPGLCKRSLFGIGEIVGVLTNPSEVLKSLAESRKLLEETRQEMKEDAERAQIPVSHTFSPLPGFFPRPNEIKALERALGGVPGFTVLFGASSVGKTALLRQVLSSPRFHVLHFDLRIAGFADLQSLYFSLAQQMESYFAVLPKMMGEEWGWGDFEKESWAFKHDRLAIEKRVEGGGYVKTSDIAHLMELFQSALLKYWEFEPMSKAEREAKETEEKARKAEKEEGIKKGATENQEDKPVKKTASTTKRDKSDPDDSDLKSARTVQENAKDNGDSKVKEDSEKEKPPPKKIPVFLLDEAHKLPALIQAEDAMKALLDAKLVLSKQDRLCHIIHASSDPFYMHWLRQMNIMQHCQILSVGDCSKMEAKKYFNEDLLPNVPENLRSGLHFDELYKIFGGKLAHLGDFTTEFVNSDGMISPLESSHFLQAYSLLNLQLVHTSPLRKKDNDGEQERRQPSGFEIYSSLNSTSPHAAASPFNITNNAPTTGTDFTNEDLLLVMKRLAPSKKSNNEDRENRSNLHVAGEIPYFPLCRELGARAVDGMVKGRILELRWSATITEEGETDKGVRKRRERPLGPVLVPTTSVVKFAMGEVLKENATA